MATQTYIAERTLSALFKEQTQVDSVIRRLLDREVPEDHISVMGRNFESETRISGFISKKDVIFGGLRTGAIFGSLIGSVFSLLSGVGVLFVPFIGSVVAAGPLGTVLLGAASGAIAGSAGAGLASFLTTLGMPEEKAAIYQTRLKAGEFLLMVEVPMDKTGEYQLMLESQGGADIHTIESTLPRPCAGRCEDIQALSPEVRNHLSEPAQHVFIRKYNEIYDQTNDTLKAEQSAWEAIHAQFDENENGVYEKEKAMAA